MDKFYDVIEKMKLKDIAILTNGKVDEKYNDFEIKNLGSLENANRESIIYLSLDNAVSSALDKTAEYKEKLSHIQAGACFIRQEDIHFLPTGIIPVVVVLFILAVLAILTHTDWNGNFGIEIFNEFHTWLTELAPVEDFTIMHYLLGINSAQAFGEYSYVFALISTLIIAALLIAYLYQMKFNELIQC